MYQYRRLSLIRTRLLIQDYLAQKHIYYITMRHFIDTNKIKKNIVLFENCVSNRGPCLNFGRLMVSFYPSFLFFIFSYLKSIGVKCNVKSCHSFTQYIYVFGKYTYKCIRYNDQMDRKINKQMDIEIQKDRQL